MKELMIAVVLALGIAVGCSQTDGAKATPLPNQAAPTVAATAAATIPNLVTPTAAANPAPTTPNLAAPTAPATATSPDPQSVPARSGQRPPSGRGFVPLDDPVFLAAEEAEYLGDDELVLGVEWADEVRAYPIRMLRYHHVVNDSVGGSPLLVTY